MPKNERSTQVPKTLIHSTCRDSQRTENRRKLRFFKKKFRSQENLHLEPIVTIPQGTRLLIIPAEDIYLARPDSLVALGDYQKSAAKQPTRKETAASSEHETSAMRVIKQEQDQAARKELHLDEPSEER
jgi:hypothetical protein